MRTAINAAIIIDKQILIVRKKETWILPGGKPDSDESDIECLCREVSEELSGTQLENIHYYKGFTGTSPHKGDCVAARVYFAEIKGVLGKPSGEIAETDWIRGQDGYNLSDITSKVVGSLTREGYLG